MGAKPDLEIIALLAKEMRSDWVTPSNETVFQEIRRLVLGYDVPLAVIETGGVATTTPATGELSFRATPELVRSAGNTLFTSGTMSKYSNMLNAVMESPGSTCIAIRAVTKAEQRAVPVEIKQWSRVQISFFLIVTLIKIAIVFAVFMTTLAYLQWVERKVLAHIQSRTGPLRVGPHGLLQPLADVFKLLTKEDLMPPHASRFFYLLAPFIAVSLALALITISGLSPLARKFRVFGGKTFMEVADLKSCGRQRRHCIRAGDWRGQCLWHSTRRLVFEQ